MAKKWPGGIITKNQATPTGPYQNGRATGIWTLSQQSYWKKQNLWPIAGNQAYFINSLGAAGTTETYAAVAIDATGNIYCAGNDSITGTDALLTKYNSSGVIQWQKTLGYISGGFDFKSIILDSSNNIYLTYNAGGFECIAKYDSAGTFLLANYPSGVTLGLPGITIDSSGNIYQGGFYYANTGYQCVIFKYNSSGAIQSFQKVLSSPTASTYKQWYEVACDSSGNIYGAGYTSVSTVGSYDCLLGKYDSAGTLQWQVRNGTAGTDVYNGIGLDSSGNIYCAGYISNGSLAILAKYNPSNGAIVWQRTLSVGIFNNLAVDSVGNSYCIGQSSVAKYDSSGVIQWQRNFSRTGWTVTFRKIVVDNSGAMYIAGDMQNQTGGLYDALLVKLPTDGTLTGTYGTYTYSVSSYTDAAASTTAAATTLTDTNLARTTASPTSIAGTASYTSTTTTL